MRFLTVILIYSSFHFSGFSQEHSQNTYSFGAKLGLGGSIFPMHATLDSNGSIEKVYSGTTLSTGVIVQYMIGNRIGIESGTHLSHYSYYDQTDAGSWGKRIGKGSAAMEMLHYQVPVAIVYRVSVPSHPFSDITLVGGTSIDWLVSDFLMAPTHAAWLKNIYGSMRIGKERMKGRKLEYGLEFQYALNRFSLKGTNYNQLDYKLHSRISLLSFNLYYFFYNKRIV